MKEKVVNSYKFVVCENFSYIKNFNECILKSKILSLIFKISKISEKSLKASQDIWKFFIPNLTPQIYHQNEVEKFKVYAMMHSFNWYENFEKKYI